MLRKARRLLASVEARRAARRAAGALAAKETDAHLAATELAAFLAGGGRFVVPAADEPLVSIVLVLYGQAPLTFRCLRSIREAAGCPVEVILVDNASPDETPRLLDRIDGVRQLRNAQNLHFVRGCNQGAKLARAPFLLLLNNDVRLLPGALEAALTTLRSADDVGVVGARIVLLDGSLQEAGCIVWRDGSCIGYGRGEDPLAAPFAFRREVDFCSGAFFLVRRELFERLGGFDDAFAPAYYEEVDFCLRAKAAGLRTLYEPAATVLHHEFASSRGAADAIALQLRNRGVFVARHGADLARRPEAVSSSPLVARSAARARSRILFLEDGVPHPGLGRGYPRSHRMLLDLVAEGHFVTLYPMGIPAEPWEEVYADVPREVEVMLDHGARRLPAFFEERLGYYDTILVCRPHNMRNFLHAWRDAAGTRGRPRVVYDAEAVFALREIERRRLAARPPSEAEAERLIEDETGLARQADVVLAVSRREAGVFAERGIADVRVLGHAVEAAPTPAPFVARRHLLFVGAMPDADSPNTEALVWFVEQVMPRLGRLLGDGVLLLVAGANDANTRRLASPAVRMLGYVPALDELYASCRMFVAPQRFAGGIPWKVHEAAARGLPTVASTLIASQLGWRDGDDVVAADATDPEAFAAACSRLYTDETLWQHVREGGLQQVRRDCDAEAFRMVLAAVFG